MSLRLGEKVRRLACLRASDPWSPLAPPIRRIPDSCGKAGKPLSSFLFPISGLLELNLTRNERRAL